MEPAFDKNLLIQIGSYMLEGLTEDEACIMIGFPTVKLHSILENDESVRNFIDKKKVEFKHKHLKVIATKSSDKNSMYILEKLRPDEFGNKRSSGDTTVNIISAIIKDIQNGSEQNAIIGTQAVVLGPKSNQGDTAPRSVNEILK